MTRRKFIGTESYPRCTVLAAFVAIIVLSGGCQKSQQAPNGPQTFASPDAAGSAVYQASMAGDGNSLLTIFGPGATDLISSGDPVQDKSARDRFAASYDQMHRWGKLTNGGMVLNVGADNYPFPFPLVKNSSGQWYFDSSDAQNEIIVRRIGDNELAAIDVLNAMADAQVEYFSQTHDGSSVHQYAQKLVSDAGKQNGLYWPAAEGQPKSPLGPLAAFATAEGYTVQPNAHQSFHGYYFRILSNQGDKAKGGAKDYVIDGKMTGGFAFVAYPAEYGNSGIMTFIVDQEGIVYQKDLGAKTADVAASMAEYNPGDGWNSVVGMQATN